MLFSKHTLGYNFLFPTSFDLFFRFCNGDIKSWIYLHFWYSFPTLDLFISKRMFFTFLLLYSVAMLSFSESGVVENCHVPPALTRCNKKCFSKLHFDKKFAPEVSHLTNYSDKMLLMDYKLDSYISLLFYQMIILSSNEITDYIIH